jgi:hypothetical protein
MSSFIQQMEEISCHTGELEYLLQTIHDGGEFDARTGSLVSIAERLTNALNEEMVALIVAYRQQREGASHE